MKKIKQLITQTILTIISIPFVLLVGCALPVIFAYGFYKGMVDGYKQETEERDD